MIYKIARPLSQARTARQEGVWGKNAEPSERQSPAACSSEQRPAETFSLQFSFLRAPLKFFSIKEKKMFPLGTQAERAAAGRERTISFQITTRSARASGVLFKICSSEVV